MKVTVTRFTIEQIAGCALLAAESASFFHGRAILAMSDVTELILIGAFKGINELCRMPKNVEDKGLIIYLRSAVKALKLVEMKELTDPVQPTDTTERSFAPPKAPVFRYPSLFSPGMFLV